MNKFQDLWIYLETIKPQIEKTLATHLPLAPAQLGTNFNEALNYAIFPGGKRLRPALTLLGAELVGGKPEKVLCAAAAVEFVHTSSLVFDDLPCMDDAEKRRGRQALHQQYGQGTAVLVGLALLNASYGLIFENLNGDCAGCATVAVRAHRELVECVGAAGMVGGQSIDLALAEQTEAVEANSFESLRNLKTSALMRMALRLGAILAGANEKQLQVLSRFAELLGDAYQTKDDLLDLNEDLHISEITERRQTLALEQGIENAERLVGELIADAKNILRIEFGADESPTKLLCSMADYIADRKF